MRILKSIAAATRGRIGFLLVNGRLQAITFGRAVIWVRRTARVPL